MVLCTAPENEATDLARRLLDARLVACVNLIGPVRSMYWWQGEIETAQEILMVIKASTASVPELRERLAGWHSYDVPEILEFRTDSGLDAYLSWVAGECRREP